MCARKIVLIKGETVMFCGNCGKPIAYANAKFCPACGAPVRVQPDAANEPQGACAPRPEEPERPPRR
ncbi:MAG: zinc-ribbon domain-containing protein [Gemmiger formicilis]|uniref:zinc-ribbon domain-containing protein n=1 Tax=Gemmiger formicilis TaxID=745368 RepID=UPI0039919028